MISTTANITGTTPYGRWLSQGLTPLPQISVTEWANKNIYLPTEVTDESGPFDADRMPYAIKIMDALGSAEAGESIVVMKGTQLGLTTAGINWWAYTVLRKPGPFMMVLPTLKIAKLHSDQKITPIINGSPIFRDRIRPAKERESGNSVFIKKYPGGMLSIGGANVAGSFRNFSAQYIILEEIDEYPEDLEGQGNPINLAKARADKFGNSRKFYILSSPTIVDGPIDTEFKNSNQQYYHIPCPYCGGMQYFEVDRLRYKKTAQWTVDGHVTYECKHCNKLIEEYHKTEMMALKNGATWIAHNPDHPKQGFHISSMYSPLGWLSWASMAADELEAQKENDVAKLKTYRNTRCALPWDDIMIEQQTTGAYERHKDFTGSIVPMAALALTAAVDVHGDRLEVEVAAWAPLEESWSMEYHIIPGDPEDRSTWEALDEFRKQLWRHESGALLGISKITVDTGYKTDEVYAYVRPRRHSGVVPVKGSKLPGKPVISKRPTKQKLPAGDILLYEIGTDTAKDSIYWRLNNQKIEPVPEPYIYAPLALAEPVKLLPGKMHFPKDREDEYFRQLFGEKVVKKKKSGRIVRSYEQIREDNHALDLRVYNLAALRILRPNWARLAKEIAARAEKERALADPKVAEAAVPEKAVQQLSTAPEKKFNARPRGHNRGGWVTQGTMWRPAR